MDNLFSIGELAKYQNISKQTLIYYDKIGLFRPAQVDPETGYRYYSAEQLDYLDTILIMKKIGFSLREIKSLLQNYTTANAMTFFHRQLDVIGDKIRELTMIQNRLRKRCDQVEQACAHASTEPQLERTKETHLLCCPVQAPYSAGEISIATKKCYAQALSDQLPIYFESGVSVPLERIRDGRYTQASTAFLTTEQADNADNIYTIPEGLTVSVYHFGNYYDMAGSYQKLLDFCREKNLKIISDSYEFCINDYITSRYEDEFITKILFYVRENSEKIRKNGAV